MNNKSNLLPWVGGLVVVVGLLIAFVWYPKDFAPSTSAPLERPQSIIGYTKENALPANFPPELVLDTNVSFEVAQFSDEDSGSANGAVVVWRSSSSSEALFAAYKDYFSKHQWTITHEDTGMPIAWLLVATRDSAKAVVSISSDVAGARVTAE